MSAAGKGAWRISTDQGEKVYNQYHFLPLHYSDRHGEDTEEIRDEEDEAYAKVQSSPTQVSADLPTSSRYNLRPRDRLRRPDFYHSVV